MTWLQSLFPFSFSVFSAGQRAFSVQKRIKRQYCNCVNDNYQASVKNLPLRCLRENILFATILQEPSKIMQDIPNIYPLKFFC